MLGVLLKPAEVLQKMQEEDPFIVIRVMHPEIVLQTPSTIFPPLRHWHTPLAGVELKEVESH